MSLFSRAPVVPVLRFSGPIGMSTSFKPGLSLATAAGPIEKAFTMSKCKSVVIVVNSPGGSPVQSNLIFRRVRQLAEENKKRVYVFAEDVCASGGYFLALSGDEIYADPSSIIGSIGVISAGFGFEKAIAKLGVDRRVYTAGRNKGSLDPFLPENPDDIERLKAIQTDIHGTFVAAVKERRGDKLKDDKDDMFTGAFWAGPRAVEMGLIDGLADMRKKMRELHGDKVKLRLVPFGGGGLLARLKRLPGMDLGRIAGEFGQSSSGLGGSGLAGSGLAGSGLGGAVTSDVLSALETRELWARYGL